MSRSVLHAEDPHSEWDGWGTLTGPVETVDLTLLRSPRLGTSDLRRLSPCGSRLLTFGLQHISYLRVIEVAYLHTVKVAYLRTADVVDLAVDDAVYQRMAYVVFLRTARAAYLRTEYVVAYAQLTFTYLRTYCLRR